MANPEHLKILRQGVGVWNRWRLENPESSPDLSEAELAGADLKNANLTRADLTSAKLAGADLAGAHLGDAHLLGADLSGANFAGAYLVDANVGCADVKDSNFAKAVFEFTLLGELDLSQTRGLAQVVHCMPSYVSTGTLELTADGLGTFPERQGEVEEFYRGAGVLEHLIEYYRARVGCPFQFYTAFISYSHQDKHLARRLYADLRAHRIRCWLDDRDMRVGEPILDTVNQAIRRHDKLLLCCSAASLNSSWVEDEVAMAFEIERKEDRRVLIPLDLDGALFDWTSGKAPRIRERLAANFQGWEKEPEVYDREFERVVDALRPEAEEPRS